MSLVIAGNSASGYNLTKSLRFRSSASAYLNRTPASAGNLQAWTWSGWIKLGIIDSGLHVLFQADTSSVDTLEFDNGTLNAVLGASNLNTTAVFRDPAAWYHIVWNYNGATQNVYVNNVLMVSGSKTGNTKINSAVVHYMGTSSGGRYFDGYMTEVNFIGGQALTPSSFGSTNALTGVWQPAKYSGTYGTNGFYLPFTNTTSTTTLGYDFSGNSNNWTTNNFSLTAGSTYDSMNDVPTLTSATTANYCVLNPISYVSAGSTITDGNLKAVTQSSGSSTVASTIGMSSGKYYSEFTFSSIPSGGTVVGIMPTSVTSTGFELGSTATSYSYLNNGQKYNNGSSSAYGASYTTSDVIGVAFDATNGTLTFYKNGTSQGTAFTGISGEFIFAAGDSAGAGSATFTANFGQQGFTYTPPTGFVALNTYNLPTSTIVKGSSYFNVGLWTSNSSAANIPVTGIGFQPSFFWGKLRSVGTSHRWVDAIRGVTKMLSSNTTGSEQTETDAFASFDSDGFTIGKDTTGGGLNYLSNTGVGWVWKGNGSGVSNTNGSITSTVSVNATAGFSVVTFTQTSGNQTVGHGLGVAPSMILQKRRNGTGGWLVYHSSLSSPNTSFLELNTTSAVQSASPFWGTVGSSTFGTSDNTCIASGTYVAYCWSQIAGFSSFGSYTGNGSADGPFIYTGFSPSFVMVKRTDTTGNWFIVDDKRLGYNGGTKNLYPNLSNAEATLELDLISNGFKWRLSGADVNASGGTFIYMAFAENPFKNALAR